MFQPRGLFVLIKHFCAQGSLNFSVSQWNFDIIYCSIKSLNFTKGKAEDSKLTNYIYSLILLLADVNIFFTGRVI